MKRSLPVLIVATLVLLTASEGKGGTLVRDFSGDAMQNHNSHMMDSPLQRIPPVLGLSFWPFISYLPAPSLTVVNVEVIFPTVVAPTSLSPPKVVPSKFWTNRCGVFVEIEVNSDKNLLEEERTSCSPQ